MFIEEGQFPGNGLPPMPGVHLDESGESREGGLEVYDAPGPEGETLTLGDLIPEEGLPVPEFRAEEEASEETVEESASEEAVEAAEELCGETAEEPAEETAEAEQEVCAEEPEEKETKTCLFTRILYVILQFTWGIIQNVAGVIVRLIVLIGNGKEARMGTHHGAVVTKWKKSHSMGLGMFIFFGHEGAPDAKNILSHEYGHTVQSAWLGPLFLPVIGIPSYTWAFLPACVKKRKEQGIKYCSFYPERWANRLGEKITGVPGPDR